VGLRAGTIHVLLHVNDLEAGLVATRGSPHVYGHLSWHRRSTNQRRQLHMVYLFFFLMLRHPFHPPPSSTAAHKNLPLLSRKEVPRSSSLLSCIVTTPSLDRSWGNEASSHEGLPLSLSLYATMKAAARRRRAGSSGGHPDSMEAC